MVFIKLKDFYTVGGSFQMRQPISLERISANYTPDKELISRMYKGLQKVNTRQRESSGQ